MSTPVMAKVRGAGHPSPLNRHAICQLVEGPLSVLEPWTSWLATCRACPDFRFARWFVKAGHTSARSGPGEGSSFPPWPCPNFCLGKSRYLRENVLWKIQVLDFFLCKELRCGLLACRGSMSEAAWVQKRECCLAWMGRRRCGEMRRVLIGMNDLCERGSVSAVLAWMLLRECNHCNGMNVVEWMWRESGGVQCHRAHRT